MNYVAFKFPALICDDCGLAMLAVDRSFPSDEDRASEGRLLLDARNSAAHLGRLARAADARLSPSVFGYRAAGVIEKTH